LRRDLAGFTLIEIVITVAIVGLLAGIAVPTAELVLQRNSEHELRTALREIRKGIDAYKQAFDDGRMTKNADLSGYPRRSGCWWTALWMPGARTSARYISCGAYRATRCPPMPKVHRSRLGPAQLRQRCEDPREGRDVYDVYSKSAGSAQSRSI